MPLTYSPDETEERKRKAAADLAAGGTRAMGYGMDALSLMESLARKDKADARAKEVGDRDYTLRLDKQTADAARTAALDKTAAEDRALRLERQKIEDARAAEDREIAMEDRGLTLQAARDKQAQADLPRVAATLGDGAEEVDAELLDDMARQNGLDRAALEAALRAEQRARTEKSRADELARRKIESEIAENEAQAKRAGRVPTGRAPNPGPKESPIEKKQRVMRENASKLLDIVEQGGDKFDKATTLPSSGRVMGPVRDALTGWLPSGIPLPGSPFGIDEIPLPSLEEGARTEARGAEEAYNAMLFPVLGRPDAPADQEIKRLAPLMFSSKDTPAERKRKIALGRAMLSGEAVLPDEATPAAPADAAGVDEDIATADAEFGG